MIGKIILSVLGGLILLIAILLNQDIAARIGYWDGKLTVSVKYLFFEVFSIPEKPPKERRRGKGKTGSPDDADDDASDADTSDEEYVGDSVSEETDLPDDMQEKAEKKSGKGKPRKKRKSMSAEDIGELIEEKKQLIQLIWELCEKRLRYLFRSIRICDVKIDFAAADEDAFDCAMLYGKMGALAGNASAFLSSLFRVKFTSAEINALFDHPSEETRWNCSGTVKIRVWVFVRIILTVFISLMINKERYKPVLVLFSKK